MSKADRLIEMRSVFELSITSQEVRRIASAEVVCFPLRGAKAVSNIELAWLAGDTRPIVERFKQIAESTRTAL
jgi:hypothetical protein